jgi:hypothetical protein
MKTLISFRTFVAILTLFLLLPTSYGNAVVTYSASAHGSTTTGVERTGLTAYVKGNCAHCHEQHASIDNVEPAPNDGAPASFALFHDTFRTSATTAPYSVSDLFCFYCHSDTTGESIQANASTDMKNYDYSYTFGGSVDMVDGRLVDDILETFNWPNNSYAGTGSNHNLLGLQNYAKVNFPSWFTTRSDPCTACHNPHIARRNKANLMDSSYSAISLPSAHDEHWGDELNEQMSDYSSSYLSPIAVGGSYEPVGSTNPGGDLIPDYNTFCLECHGTTSAPITSVNHSTTLLSINWAGSGGDTVSAGDKHGTNVTTGDVDTQAPYCNTFDIVLSCCDCHEPHGSPYDYLMRRSINGETVNPIGVIIGDRGNQCRQCHMDDLSLGTGSENQWEGTHHGGGGGGGGSITDNPYSTKQMSRCGCHNGGGGGGTKAKIPCEDCHHHGSFVSGTTTTPVYTDPTDGINTINIPAPRDGVGRKTF